MIIDQECDVTIFILGIIYPKIMCPNCVQTKLSCSVLFGSKAGLMAIWIASFLITLMSNNSEAKIAGHHDANRDTVGSCGKSSFHRGAALPWC